MHPRFAFSPWPPCCLLLQALDRARSPVTSSAKQRLLTMLAAHRVSPGVAASRSAARSPVVLLKMDACSARMVSRSCKGFEGQGGLLLGRAVAAEPRL